MPFPGTKVVPKLHTLAAKLAHAQAYGTVGWLDYPVVCARRRLWDYLAHRNALSNPSVSARIANDQTQPTKKRPYLHRANGQSN